MGGQRVTQLYASGLLSHRGTTTDKRQTVSPKTSYLEGSCRGCTWGRARRRRTDSCPSAAASTRGCSGSCSGTALRHPCRAVRRTSDRARRPPQRRRRRRRRRRSSPANTSLHGAARDCSSCDTDGSVAGHVKRFTPRA